MKHFKLLALLLILASITACERPTKVKLTGGNPPTFILSGSGTLGSLIVYGPQQREILSDRGFALWEIAPVDGFLHGKPLEQLQSIKYGILPKGYKQIYPEAGQPLPQLVPGQQYSYRLDTVNAQGIWKYFEIRNGQAVVVVTPGQKANSMDKE